MNVIAIDGPAGSGKSTISKIVAKRLNVLYVDTGAMYRALTLKAMREGVDMADDSALTRLARSTKIDLEMGGDILSVMLDGNDVTSEIRSPEVTRNVRFVARVKGVRREMVRLQRAVGERRGAVLEGRDIGTVVFPDAAYKFYLDADPAVRAERRFKELMVSGRRIELEEVRRDVDSRDRSDMARTVGPLRKSRDAIVIDTTHLSIDGVVEKLLSYIER